MKAKLYTLLLALSAITTMQAQDKIEGVGILKIGKTTPDVINELAKDYHGKIKEATDTKYEGNGSAIFKLIYTGIDKSPIESSACPSSEVYYLKQYAISGIKLTNVYLFFYEGVLIQVLSKGSDEIENALKTKYGSPALDLKETRSSCASQTNKKYTSTWTNGNIEANLSSYFDYNSYCQLSMDRYFSIKIPDKETSAGDCHQANKDKVVDPKKKDKLKDF